MGKIYYAFLASLFCTGLVQGQNTWDLVYSDMQSSCATSGCHASGTAIGGLDLQGSGTDPQQAVYNNIVGVAPSNSFAANNGQQRIYPGDPYRSSIFRKMCDGLDDFVQLDGAEGGIMPPAGGLDETEKELVRQWILFGAPETGNVADTALIADYYNGNGVDGVPNPITAPDPSEGYQIKLGPFFRTPRRNRVLFKIPRGKHRYG